MILRRIAVLLCILFASLVAAQNRSNGNSSCPLDFSVLKPFRRPEPDGATTCQYLLQGLRLLCSHHLRKTGSFLPPLDSASSCWSDLQSAIAGFLPRFDVRSRCGFQTPWISQGCMNITTKSQFESLIPKSTLNTAVMRCNLSLEYNTPCASCTQSLSGFQAYLTGASIGNISDCAAFPLIHAAAYANMLGPTDKGTAKCLFQLDLASSSSGNGTKGTIIVGSGIGKKGIIIVSLSLILFAFAVFGAWFFLKNKIARLF